VPGNIITNVLCFEFYSRCLIAFERWASRRMEQKTCFCSHHPIVWTPATSRVLCSRCRQGADGSPIAGLTVDLAAKRPRPEQDARAT
jgi:hypothetical protein